MANLSWRNKYNNQKQSAKFRGIKFLLTFEEWMSIWEASGHMAERGRKRGQYNMARLKDKGAYKIGNVKIILQTENQKERKTTDRQREASKISGRNNVIRLIKQNKSKKHRELVRKLKTGKPWPAAAYMWTPERRAKMKKRLASKRKKGRSATW